MTKPDKIKLSGNTALFSGIFALFVAVLLLLNYWQISQTDPLESTAMKSLVEQFANDPGNQDLQQEIRSLDLLARKAYFSSRWQIKTGSYLLIIASILFVLSLRLYFSLIGKIDRPEATSQNEIGERILSHKWLLGVSVVILLMAIFAGFKSENYFELFENHQMATTSEIPEDPGIEVIEIREEKPQLENEKDEVPDSVPKNSIAAKELILPAEESKKEDKTVPESSPSFPTLPEIQKQHNSFRGPLGQGTTFAKNIPTDWDGPSGKNILWKADIPLPGYNSPVIWDEKILVAGGNSSTRSVYCFNKKDGSLLWQHEVKNVPGSPGKIPKTTDDTGLSAPSLTTDGQRVYGIFGNGDIICTDMEGNQIWAKNLGVPDNHYGHSSSLISWKEKLFVQYDTNKGGKIITLNVFTGDVIWQKTRESKISWASPILAKIDGSYQLILSANPIVAGYNLEDGKELWAVKCMSGEVGPSPAFADGIIYAANEYAKLVAINSADNYTILWSDNEYLPEVSSPAVSKGLLFIATSFGVFACYDAKSGEKYWEYESPNGFYGSPMIADGKVYTLDMQGIMYIMEVSKEFNLIGQPEIGEETTTTPAFSDGRIFIRTNRSLYCIGEK
ncbi:MAG: PQQ-binding-like beta-propeller repeat protein [Bacteroidales bacterium]|nr:PQQ-binding-like beta-propeller repeat protein [Bacteroidales bacterium]MCF8456108.1 PQQ-binding-like beta-propeller repeat protein [Bacteroidales bacterium]